MKTGTIPIITTLKLSSEETNMSYDFDREMGIEESLEAQEICATYPDNCQVCKGLKGGVRGNEQIVECVVMCDYCHAEHMAYRARKAGI